jgi:hypothetical protein
MKKTQLASVWVACITGSLAVAACGNVRSSTPREQSTQQVTSVKGLDPEPPPCGPAPIGTLSQLAPGHSIADVAAEGYSVLLQLPLPDGSTAVVVGKPGYPADEAPLLNPSNLAPLIQQGILSSARSVLSEPSDPTLATCDYSLSDRPAASPIVALVEQYEVSRGLATTANFAGAGAFILSDNPYASGSLIVSIQIADSVSPIAGPGSPMLVTGHDLAALFDRSSGTVTAAAAGKWY